MRETFATRFGAVVTTIGVAIGLGNVWRFPYMTGRHGGAGFVIFYLVVVAGIGVPALMAEFALGRRTRRGTVGAFERSGLPGGWSLGWFFFAVVAAATAYYTNVIGWVLWHAIGQATGWFGAPLDAAAALPPDRGFSARALGLQVALTAAVIAAAAWVLDAGVRRGIERASRWITPTLFLALGALIARGLTLPGAWDGVAWYVLKIRLEDLAPGVMLAALGQAIFSLSLGGTFMVVYGSYLDDGVDLRRLACWTAAGDTAAGLLAGFAIFPIVFALGQEPASGPALVFSTLPAAFARIPAGALFGLIFFAGLGGAAFLSDIAAFEVLVAGLTDNTTLSRRRAVILVACLVLLLSIPPMINMRIFVGWDLTFGSGMQTLGALIAVIAVGWSMGRAAALEECSKGGAPASPWLVAWLRWVIPGACLAVGVWWLLHEAIGLTGAS